MAKYAPKSRRAVQDAMRHAMIEDEQKLALELEFNLRELRDHRRPYEEQFKEIAELVVPKYEFVIDQWLTDTEYDGAKGWDKRQGEKIYDHTAAISLKTLADGLMGYLVPRQSRWFHLIFQHKEIMELPGVRAWVQEVEDLLYDALTRSNFYDELHAAITIAGSFGTVVQYREYDEETMAPHFATRNPVETMIASNFRGQIDTFYRTFRMTKRQAEQMFDPMNLSERIKDSRNPTKLWTFLHAVFPRSDLDVEMGLYERKLGSVLACDAPYASVYKEIAGSGTGSGATTGNETATASSVVEKVLSVGGYWECPYICWRWETETQSVYGSSPTRDLMPIIRRLQKWGNLLDTNAEMNTVPPTNVPKEMGTQYQMFPRGVNYYTDPMRVVAPMGPFGTYPIGKDREDDARFMVKEAYGTDTFLLLRQLSREGQGGDRTAYETAELVSERAAILGSAMGRMETDFLTPSVLYTYRQESQRGNLPDPPEALTKLGRPPMKLDMISMLALAQRQLKHRAVMQAIQAAAPLAEIPPGGAFDVLDKEGLVQDMLEDAGVPAKRMLTEEQMSEIKAQRAAAAERAEQRENLDTAGSLVRAAGGAEEAMAAAGLGTGQGVAEAVATGR